MYNVSVVTTTRAEYGILRGLLKEIDAHNDMNLQLIVSGTHLKQKYGMTVNEIEKDGFSIAKKIDILEDNDSSIGIIKTMSNAQILFGEAFKELDSSVVVVLGDRYEMLPIVSSALMLHIPICHLHGGEITQGAIDEVIRHAISKMATIHFPSCKEYASRLIQMGEMPSTVYPVGALGVENVLKLPKLSKEELTKEIGIEVDKDTLLVTFHPVTNEIENQKIQMQSLLTALHQINKKVIFTRPNSDEGREELNSCIDGYLKEHDNAKAFDSLGLLRYLSAMSYCGGVVGNSSSGIIEAPSFHVPTLDIGNRQQGRITSKSVYHVEPNVQDIYEGLQVILSPKFNQQIASFTNPYEGKDTAKEITRILYKNLQNGFPKSKQFYDIK